jgi:endonuclease-8
MAEGPLVHYYARKLRRVLKGRKAQVTFGVRKLKPFEPSLNGILIKDVEAYGKQFRIRFSDGRVLLVHLMMWGSWGIFSTGEPWGRPRQRARAVLRTNSHEAVVFSAPVVRLLTEKDLESDSKWGNLGPDPLRRDFSRKEFFKRLNADPSRLIGEVLLDQTVVSGIGNILRIEILFRARIHPKRLVGGLSTADKRRILGWTMRLMRKWLDERDKEDDWIRIYRRSSKPCPRCGEKVESFRQGGRITYACSGCQPQLGGRT